MLTIGVFPADEGGCGHYRMIWPWETVAKQFPDEIKILWGKDIAKDCIVGWAGGPWPEGREPTEYHVPIELIEHPQLDVAIFQRPLLAKSAPYFKLLREQGTFVVVDLDDNFDRVHRNNIAWYASEPHWMREEEMKTLSMYLGMDVTADRKAETNKDAYYHVPAHQGVHNRRNIAPALREVDLLIVSTPALKRHYGKYAETRIIDNYVPEWYFDHRRAEDDQNPSPIVGWTGSVATHPTDLQVMGVGLQMLRRQGDVFTFKVVGTGVRVHEAAGLEPDTTSGGWVDLLDGSYQREYASFDVGLCPLDDIAFNHAKSWLKGIEAAALGVVPVMSPLPEYQRLVDDGIGMLAKRPKDWTRHVRKLLQDPCMRRDMADLGQEIVRDHYTMEGNAWRWVEAVTEGIKNR